MIIPFPSIDPKQQSLGRRLRAIREARGLSVEELASAACVTEREVTRAELGRQTLSSRQMRAVIGALRVPAGLLFAKGVDLSQIRPF
ncbi:helix-turn-helix domain-containing protein [Phenylobacterium sp.]|uniref:helix-turn-helix domain-containing protein n=1 Tax=Phenylobacterium sp. TaxID=1871053 RepID=UPI0035B1B816